MDAPPNMKLVTRGAHRRTKRGHKTAAVAAAGYTMGALPSSDSSNSIIELGGTTT
jgi:hypothetical protein